MQIDQPHQTQTIMRYEEAIDFLFGRINYERTEIIPKTFKLDRMRALARLLGGRAP